MLRRHFQNERVLHSNNGIVIYNNEIIDILPRILEMRRILANNG